MIGLINLADLQRGLQREREMGGGAQRPSTLRDCLRSELVWLPGQASLSELEDQLLPGGLRQVPVFAVPADREALLPEGLRELGARSIPNPFGGAAWSLDWIKDMRMILYSLLLILLMLLRPQGLFHRGEKRRARA